MGAYFGRYGTIIIVKRSLTESRYSMLGDCVGVLAGERWETVRKHFDPEFSFQASRQGIPMFTREIAKWATKLSSTANGHGNHRSSFVLDVSKPTKFLMFELVAHQLYGEAFNQEMKSAMKNSNGPLTFMSSFLQKCSRSTVSTMLYCTTSSLIKG